jgi:hypothetical protein
MLYDYKCSKCDFQEEYSTSPSVPKDMNPPEICPKCKEGKLVIKTCFDGQSFDCPGAYDYTYGKKAYRKNLSNNDMASVLLGDKAPY